jgi:outer membrane protein OmpA-like peptidoglycan-associated protein
MPGLTPEKKDRLYNSVQRAREMRKIVEISFSSGQTEIPANFENEVKRLLDADEVRKKFRDDLTAVFVVLGFADTKGNEQVNLVFSDKRAKSVVKFMESACGVKNVTHAVAMGSTTLVDKNNAAKNRVAEIWAVLP